MDSLICNIIFYFIDKVYNVPLGLLTKLNETNLIFAFYTCDKEEI